MNNLPLIRKKWNLLGILVRAYVITIMTIVSIAFNAMSNVTLNHAILCSLWFLCIIVNTGMENVLHVEILS